MTTRAIVQSECLVFLRTLQDECIDLIYIDPPFNTGKKQKRDIASYEDSFDDLIVYLTPRLVEAKRVLKSTGSIFLHLDWREVHYAKVFMDGLFGRDRFVNEIIWSYDYGGRPKNKWPNKHDTILWYSKSSAYTYRYDDIIRIPYMAPSLVGAEKAARGKTPTDVWWNTIVPTNGKEKTGYPTQKPMGIMERIITVHSNPGDTVLDFFAGSGTTGHAAAKHDRNFILVDQNPEAIEVMRIRLYEYKPELV